ncbi:MAG TPA: DUF2059 domain-containing protein [Paracoccaceae bacterium]|nr:DUF2059 domain-containing protein [Paracoccaceae bacterium]
MTLSRSTKAILVALCVSGASVATFVPGGGSMAQAAETPAAELERILLIPDLLEIMQKEGVAYGEEVASEFFEGEPDSDWSSDVARIYDPARIGPAFHQAFEEELARTGSDPAPMIEFFRSDLGQRILTLELSARSAMIDDAIEEEAKVAMDRLEEAGDPRLTMIRAYVAANHLVDMNVSSALNANLAFLTGLSQAGGFQSQMPEDEILAQVWSQEEEVRVETERWLLSFSLMAYSPLSDQDMQTYIAFSETPAGVALNRALYAAYDGIFTDISRELGLSAGRRMGGTSL